MVGEVPTTPQNNPQRPHECFEKGSGWREGHPIKRIETNILGGRYQRVGNHPS